MEGAEPRRPDKIRTPEKPLAGHTVRPAFPASGKPRFFTGCTSISSPCLSPFFRRTPTPENCGFVLCTKCGPCHTARKQFSKGLRSKTGVQQHPKNAQKGFFDKLKSPGRGFSSGGLIDKSIRGGRVWGRVPIRLRSQSS